MFLTGIDVDIDVRTRNKDEKTGDVQRETDNKKDGKSNASEEELSSAMDVDDKHDKEANASAARTERETPETESWTVVNGDTMQQSMDLYFEFLPVLCLE
jgi:hypothetical protein